MPAHHLLQRFVLFTLTLVFFLSLTRAALALWQLDRVVQSEAVLALFIVGLRFDLALCGVLLLIPVALGTLLGMFQRSVWLGRCIVLTGLVGGLLLVTVAELVTPVFINEMAVRPDLAQMLSMEQPVELAQRYLNAHPLPLTIGGMLLVLIMIAFIGRLEPGRLLRQRVTSLSGLIVWIGATLACLFAIVSGTRLTGIRLSIQDAEVSSDPLVNELALNTLYKILHELARTL